VRCRWRRSGAVLVAVLLALVTAPTVAPGAARAEDSEPLARSAATTYKVTFAARACARYEDVMANQVRDDLAPGRPGKDSAYPPGRAVDPKTESDVGCEPLAGVPFTLGTGRVTTEPLSAVAGPGAPVVTEAQSPRLDPAGHPDGGQLAGSVTVTLTDDQVTLAGRRQLWAQGGASGAPVPSGHSFGVLRCAIDGRTGGNTQWIAFPAGVRHVFCYAYYVRGVATGTLTAKLRTTRPVGYPQRIPFESTLGAFALAADSAETTFVRRAGEVHRLRPQLPAGWRIAGLTCAAARATADQNAGLANVTLNPGEAASCVFTVEPPAAPPGLTIRVTADSGATRFDITAKGAGQEFRLAANPRDDGSAAVATGADLTAAPPGAYDVTAIPPAAEAKLWSATGGACNGAPVALREWTLPVQLAAGAPLDCVIRVRRQQGSVTLRAATAAVAASAGFVLVPAGDAASGWSATATTQSDQEVAASGEVPSSLPFGGYVVTALPPASTVDNSWRLAGFGCGTGGAAEAVVRVELTAAAPAMECRANFEAVPHARLSLTVRAKGATPPDGTGVDVECADGSAGRAVLAGGTTGPADLPRPLAFAERTTCVVSSPRDGSAPRGTSLVVESAPTDVRALPTTLALDEIGAEIRLAVVLTYEEADRTTIENAFGSINIVPFALIGSGLVGIGAMVLLVLIVRRRMGLD
jgi:hypothetical protein